MVSPTRLGGSPVSLETRPLATYGTDSKGGRLRWTRRPAEPVPPAGDPGLARIRFGSTTQLAQQHSGRPRGPLTISKPHRPTGRRSYRRPLLQTEGGDLAGRCRPTSQPSRSCRSAGWTIAASSSPEAATTTCRLPSLSCQLIATRPPSIVTDWLSPLATLGAGSLPARSRA